MVKVTKTSQLDREAEYQLLLLLYCASKDVIDLSMIVYPIFLPLSLGLNKMCNHIKKKMSIVFEKRKTSCDSSVQLCMKKSEIGFILPCHSVLHCALPTKSFHSKPLWQMSLAKLRAFSFFIFLKTTEIHNVHNGTIFCQKIWHFEQQSSSTLCMKKGKKAARI